MVWTLVLKVKSRLPTSMGMGIWMRSSVTMMEPYGFSVTQKSSAFLVVPTAVFVVTLFKMYRSLLRFWVFPHKIRLVNVPAERNFQV
jgi:hypothetical protein